MEMLIAKGADVNSKTNGGHSALQYSCSRDRPEVSYCTDIVCIEGSYENYLESLDFIHGQMKPVVSFKIP